MPTLTPPPPAPAKTDSEPDLLDQAQRYLNHRQSGLPTNPLLESHWAAFHERTTRKIRAFAYTCGAAEDDMSDCVQDVWSELLARLPSFRLDPRRGQFDTWLFPIVRSKTSNLRRARTRRPTLDPTALLTIPDSSPTPARTLENSELLALVLARIRSTLTDCNYQILRLRLFEQRPVAEVAQTLGLTGEQVWYRYHRARREIETLADAMSQNRHPTLANLGETRKFSKSAQGSSAVSVSRNIETSFPMRHGGHCVDYVFQRLELGRRDLCPEWKVEWNCDAAPKSTLYTRKSAFVAYAEICGPGDYVAANWPRIVNAAITAGVAAGIATIIATPTAALPIFKSEFQRHLQGKAGIGLDDKISVALSARQEASGPWSNV